MQLTAKGGDKRLKRMHTLNHRDRDKTIDHLLGALSPEEKAGQMLVLGFNGSSINPELEALVTKLHIGGLRTSPYLRKFKRYLPEGSKGMDNVVRPIRWGEKVWDSTLKTRDLRASEYAAMLNHLRKLALDRKHALPLHFTIDCESGGGSNFLPPGFITFPSAMGLGRLADTDLIYRTYRAVGRQLRAIGLNHVHGPVVDVNTNPNNPEISTRSFSPDPQVVVDCARAALNGFRDAGIIATLKHYPGRGASAEDAHFGLCEIHLDREAFYREHLLPYRVLCGEKIVPSIMPAHTVYPNLDASGEIATVSKPILTGILREEFGYDGVITTDSITMGGLMARYSVAEASIKAIEAGVDILLLKDDNDLRYEIHQALVDAIKDKRLSEERVACSLRRIWSLKWDYGLFTDGGMVRTEGLDEYLHNDAFRDIDCEAAARSLQVLRDRAGILPLRPEHKLLVIDQIPNMHLFTNHSWNYPGMLWDFLNEQSPNVSYVDYFMQKTEAITATLEELAPQADVLLVTTGFDRNSAGDAKAFISGLKRFGKPVILVSNNPYQELIVPEDMDTVIVTYSLMRASMHHLSRFLYQA